MQSAGEHQGLLAGGLSSRARQQPKESFAVCKLLVLVSWVVAIVYAYASSSPTQLQPQGKSPFPSYSVARMQSQMDMQPLVVTMFDDSEQCPLVSTYCTTARSTGRCVPAFVVVGAMKAGSTAIINALDAHPNVYTYPKVLRWGNALVEEDKVMERDFIWSSGEYSLEGRLEKYFTASGVLWGHLPNQTGTREQHIFRPTARAEVFPGDCRLSGVKTPTYLTRPEVAGRLLELFPDTKIIVSLREPISRITSQVHMERIYVCPPEEAGIACTAKMLDDELREGFAVERKHIEECSRHANLWGVGEGPLLLDHVEAFERRMECWPDEHNGGDNRAWLRMRLMHSMYAPALQRYFRLFGRDRVKVVLFDEWVSDDVGVLNDLVQWLGLSSMEHVDLDASQTTPGSDRHKERFRGVEKYDMPADIAEEYRVFLRPYIAPLKDMLPEVDWPAAWDVWWES